MNKYSDCSEEELLRKVRNDDYEAFDEIYKRHAHLLIGTAFNITRDKEAAKDIIQDIFTWFWTHRDSCESITTCKGYLLTAVKFKASNYFRSIKTKTVHYDRYIAEYDGQIEEPSDLEVKELYDFIKTVVSRLPARCKVIFELSRYEHLSNKEIAARLSISEKTVENQLTIALRRLRLRLGIYFFIILLII